MIELVGSVQLCYSHPYIIENKKESLDIIRKLLLESIYLDLELSVTFNVEAFDKYTNSNLDPTDKRQLKHRLRLYIDNGEILQDIINIYDKDLQDGQTQNQDLAAFFEISLGTSK